MHDKMKNALSNLSVIAAQYVPKDLKAALLGMAKEIDALKGDCADMRKEIDALKVDAQKRKDRDENRAKIYINKMREYGMSADVIQIMQDVTEELGRVE